MWAGSKQFPHQRKEKFVDSSKNESKSCTCTRAAQSHLGVDEEVDVIPNRIGLELKEVDVCHRLELALVGCVCRLVLRAEIKAYARGHDMFHEMYVY